jgi:hypothetical protein
VRKVKVHNNVGRDFAFFASVRTERISCGQKPAARFHSTSAMPPSDPALAHKEKLETAVEANERSAFEQLGDKGQSA